MEYYIKIIISCDCGRCAQNVSNIEMKVTFVKNNKIEDSLY